MELTGEMYRVPQQPDRGPRRELALVGLAAQPQARVVLPGLLRVLHVGGHLRRRQHGDLVAGHPGDGVRGFQAYRRRSLALALILIAFLAQWVSWARIDRAAFQYHYYTSLPFVILALGYFVAEIWHGASRRTWLLARASAAVAIMGPVILWLLRYPLCALAGVESVNAGSQACNGNPGNLVVTPATAAMVVVSVDHRARAGVAAGRPRPAATGRAADHGARPPPARPDRRRGVALPWPSRGSCPTGIRCSPINGIVPEIIALIVAVPLGLMAIQVLTARDARRFVAGLLAATAAWFVILYPNISALADAVHHRQRLPGAAADVPLRVPVQREHDGPRRCDLVRGPEVRDPGGVPGRGQRRRGLLGLGVAPGAGPGLPGRRRRRAAAARAPSAAGAARADRLSGLEGRRASSPRRCAARGDGGTGAVKCGGRVPAAASRRITKP